MNKWLVLISLSLSACAAPVGSNFAPPAEAHMSLRETTVEQAKAVYGKPYLEASKTITPQDVSALRASGQMTTLVYTFFDQRQPVAKPGLLPGKRMELTFWNDKLVRYSFMSTLSVDSTSFDDTKIAQIIRGKSTRAEVEALLGKAKGSAVYPWIKTEGRTAALYESAEVSDDNDSQHTQYLSIEYDDANVVQDYSYTNSTKPRYSVKVLN